MKVSIPTIVIFQGILFQYISQTFSLPIFCLKVNMIMKKKKWFVEGDNSDFQSSMTLRKVQK